MPIPPLLSPRWRDALLQCPSPPGTAAPLVPAPATRPSPVPGLINKRAAEFRVWASATSGIQSPGTGGRSPRGQGLTRDPGGERSADYTTGQRSPTYQLPWSSCRRFGTILKACPLGWFLVNRPTGAARGEAYTEGVGAIPPPVCAPVVHHAGHVWEVARRPCPEWPLEPHGQDQPRPASTAKQG